MARARPTTLPEVVGLLVLAAPGVGAGGSSGSSGGGSPRVALVHESPQYLALVQAHLKTRWTFVPLKEDVSPASLARVEACVGEIPSTMYAGLPALRLVQTPGWQEPDTPLPPHVQACRGPDQSPAEYAPTIAEWIVAVSLELLFRTTATSDTMKGCAFSASAPSCPPQSAFGARPALNSLTYGILGYGHVGQALAERVAPLFRSVVASSPDATGAAPAPLDRWYASDEPVLRQADVVALCFGGSSGAAIDAKALRLLKPSAYLIVMAHGPGVDEQALFDALASGAMAGGAINEWWGGWGWRP